MSRTLAGPLRPLSGRAGPRTQATKARVVAIAAAIVAKSRLN
jgi:hypothetical protein